MPKLRVEGRYLKDSHGHIVNLHGFGQTYSPWFNEKGTKWSNYDVNACLNYNKGLIDKMLTAGWDMNFMRLHMDPYWSNTPGCTPKYHEAHNCFNETRFKKYLDEVFVPMAEFAISKGLYVVMRPPGVSPEEIKVGDDYQQYLIKVWGIVSKHPKLKDNPNIMFELANEPINILGVDGTYGAGTQGHFDNLKTYFQTIVDTIRVSTNNILWVPGLGYQALYAGFAVNPIESENIGYAVHVYPGWFNSGYGYEPFQRGWDNQVQPVADFAPIMVTEMDWAPARHEKSWGKDVTGTAGGDGFGANFKKIADDCGNVSWMLFTGPELLAQFGDSTASADVVDFLTDPEACPYPIYHWFQDYANVYGLDGVADSYFEMTDLEIVGDTSISVLNNSSVSLKINAVFADGHTENVASQSQVTVDNPEVIRVERGRIFAQKDGHATIQAAYTDTKGTKKEVSLQVSSTTFPLNEQLFNADIWENGTFNQTTKTLKTGPYGFGGWQYSGIDLSEYKYIVARLGGSNTADVAFNVYDGASYWGSPASYKFGTKREVVVRLKYAKKNDGKSLNSKNIYIAGFWSNGSNPFVIDTVFLSNSNEYGLPILFVKNESSGDLSKIDSLNYRENAGPSSVKSFMLSGDMLKSEVKIEATQDFEISLSEVDGFDLSLTVAPQDDVLASTPVYVRLKAGLLRKSYTGSITISSTAASTKKITLNGLVQQPVGNHPIDAESTIISIDYYSVTGQKLNKSDLTKGIFIEKTSWSNGRIVSSKKVIK
ncbi:MAG: cellulase family glycosylhydrolase [Prolixibacteraceae bacterium]|nr:cellulase family glycosylhydrolase [Prolixibacteraceae bacterium]